jgi:endogenous inhibitor of DNA gyrase (YacG/DUF329 family)
MRDSSRPSSSAGASSAGSAQAGAAPGYSCAICSAKLAAAHRYRPFCSARGQRIDLGNWLQERYVVPGAPAPTDGGDDTTAERDGEP